MYLRVFSTVFNTNDLILILAILETRTILRVTQMKFHSTEMRPRVPRRLVIKSFSCGNNKLYYFSCSSFVTSKGYKMKCGVSQHNRSYFLIQLPRDPNEQFFSATKIKIVRKTRLKQIDYPDTWATLKIYGKIYINILGAVYNKYAFFFAP